LQVSLAVFSGTVKMQQGFDTDGKSADAVLLKSGRPLLGGVACTNQRVPSETSDRHLGGDACRAVGE